MRETALQIIGYLRDQSYAIGELADAIGKSQSWTSELVSDLEDANLIDRTNGVRLATTYEATLLADLLEQYTLENVLVGTKEEILGELLDGSKTISELQQQGFAKSTLYQHLNEIRETGAIAQTDDGYTITDDTLQSFLEARNRTTPFETEFRAQGERLVVTTKDDVDGTPTAFSAFTRYGVDYHPAKTYVYQGDRSLELEAVLIHAVTVAETKKQMAMVGVFYLTHRATLDASDLWRLANRWESVERWADLFAYIDQREVHHEALFLPWAEFIDFANDYGVYPRGQHPEDSLRRGLEELGDYLETPVDVYLLGGGNLILRGLKDSTKDVDLVVAEGQTFFTIAESLQDLGYEERRDLEAAYNQLDPSIVLEKEGFPRWDIFVEAVAGQLQLTPAMIERCDQSFEYGNLHVHLLSLTDIFVFKSITEREGDLEDAALIARQAELDWGSIFQEIKTQEARTGQFFSFAVLDTLDVLEERHNIVAPITDQLVSYCLENALLVSLENPKTIEDLREELDFPDHQIYNKLRNLEEDREITVDRSGRLNTYQRTKSTDR
ncbi:ArsR family transcriptional regulator [Halobacterium salinarum]|uniref:ArsR family transcriptional regulator n=1 Tax=Halobacterium salinarum TaxID=2242 RepID=UPI0025522CCD|nr:ArsR family transcriptional regulator [Halobacterium salinarum]MDL0121127.1 ArsR family transcriptional regulator [Halobacterium salinarum]MDL0135808.1 ArsR family transcriptional regulator [Halobacterium salinarum]MDL0140654.1 ArsR family transcriptional regulator [Halobacterium salinarum]MDL0141074.1 ArsR family transcriptional regulator [Halobacterium salinarum]